jgi:hypothetical protein
MRKVEGVRNVVRGLEPEKGHASPEASRRDGGAVLLRAGGLACTVTATGCASGTL